MIRYATFFIIPFVLPALLLDYIFGFSLQTPWYQYVFYFILMLIGFVVWAKIWKKWDAVITKAKRTLPKK